MSTSRPAVFRASPRIATDKPQPCVGHAGAWLRLPTRARLPRLPAAWGADVCSCFQSRRRHTRLQGDWSSDVSSSDLSEYENWTGAGPVLVLAEVRSGHRD